MTLAERLLSLRRNAGDTLESLAARSGVSRAMISKIERGEAQPTAVLLGKLAEALGVSISALLEAPKATRSTSPKLIKYAQQKIYIDKASGFERRNLVNQARQSGAKVEASHGTLPAGCVTGMFPPHAPHTQEHIVVIEGRFDLIIGDVRGEVKKLTRYSLTKGDVISFLADRPHGFENKGKQPATYLLVTER